MASTLISAKYPPNIDPTKTPLAYGDRAIPRLNRELNDDNLLKRQRAVMSLCDFLHDPEHIAESIRNGIDKSLKNLLKDPDITVRQKATECLCIMAGYAIGRDSFLENETIYPVARLFDDPEPIARKNAHMCVMRVSETPPGKYNKGIVQAQFIDLLVKKLELELDNIKDIILDTLHFCMRVDTTDALEANAMEAFTLLLKHEQPTIRFKAARDIMDLSVPLAGKDRAVACGALQLLKDMLKDPTTEVKANAAGAIMTITITTRGKYTAIHALTIPSLVDLVDDLNSEVRLNAIKALTCLSEAPEGRQELLQHVEKIRSHTKDHIQAVASAAKIAVKVITWLP
ncbi:unnamed protein product [Lymnaea stagnalis]|uniref:Rhabdoid tumor deletion region protein 1 n=1 Tax=Lymnaea stagnalis TaxID=6523 RepID=A0AAV2H204_LYMST